MIWDETGIHELLDVIPIPGGVKIDVQRLITVIKSDRDYAVLVVLNKIEALVAEFGDDPKNCLSIVGEYVGTAWHNISSHAAPPPMANEQMAAILTAPEPKDPLFDQAKEIVQTLRKASTPLLQRKLQIGYVQSARLMDQLEVAGIIGPKDGAKPRKVL